MRTAQNRECCNLNQGNSEMALCVCVCVRVCVLVCVRTAQCTRTVGEPCRERGWECCTSSCCLAGLTLQLPCCPSIMAHLNFTCSFFLTNHLNSVTADPRWKNFTRLIAIGNPKGFAVADCRPPPSAVSSRHSSALQTAGTSCSSSSGR